MAATLSRRNLLRHTAAVAGVAVAGTALAGPASAAPVVGTPRLETVRIPSRSGVFSGVAAGPRRGRKVLLLHGFPEFGIEWTHQLFALAAAGYRAVAPDQRGYSAGVRPADIAEYQLDHPVRDVTAIADALGWFRFDLVGHDWGAAVAWVAAARCPSRIRSLAAVSVPHLGAFSRALREDPVQQDASEYMERFRRPAPVPEEEILAQGSLDLPGVPRERCDEYFRRLSVPGALTGALNWYRANDFTGYRQPVEVPTLFVASTADPMVAPSGVRWTRDWVRGRYRLVNLRGVGHNVPEEAAERTTGELLRHLRSLGPPDGRGD